MSTLTVAREALKTLLKKREKLEATAEESRMVAHIERREMLRREWEEHIENRGLESRTYESNMAALKALGEKYSARERSEDSRIRQECERLSKLVNQPRVTFGCGAKERLVESCLDTDLQHQNAVATANLEQASRELQAAKELEHSNWTRMSQAQRDIVEYLGSVSAQFGRPGDGGRWQKVEDDNGVWVQSVSSKHGEGIHPENVTFLNNNLRGPNRIIREGKAKDFGVDRLTAEVESLTEQLEAVHAAMMESDI